MKCPHCGTQIQPRFIELPPRMRQVVEHAAKGLGDKEISRQMGISPETVSTHLSRAFMRLGVRNRRELMLLATHYKEDNNGSSTTAQAASSSGSLSDAAPA